VCCWGCLELTGQGRLPARGVWGATGCVMEDEFCLGSVGEIIVRSDMAKVKI
jgi:hypothetical protein